MHKDYFGINELLSEKIQLGEPFSLLRIDNTMGYVLQCLFNEVEINSEFFSLDTLAIEAGVNPATYDYYFNTIVPMCLESMCNSDILGFVDISRNIEKDKNFTIKFGKKPMFFGHDSLMVLDPIGLLRGGIDGNFKVEIPWTKYLKNKKVLVISTHCETINNQWSNIDKIWGNNLELVAPFDLVGCIRSPYHPTIDNRQYPGCDKWHETVEYIKKEIDKYDYDILITGATTSSPIYAEHAKSRGKIGIQAGGVIQLFFGIMGYRWSLQANNGYRPWSDYYNEYWKYPLHEDGPQNMKQQHKNLEGSYAYWKR